MAYPSRYAGKCKDCGTSYEIGDMIDTNGSESLNQKGEMKAHWCKNGTNCQGAMQLSSATSTGHDMPVPKDPTPEQFLELGIKLMSDLLSGDSKSEYVNNLIQQTEYKISDELIKRSVIEKAMNDLGLKHPGRLGFIKDVLR